MSIRDFVIETVPYQSEVARSNLIAQGFAVFYPTVLKTRKHPRFQSTSSTYEEPLFPGYVFVSFDPTDPTWRAINGTRGVKRLICNGETPIPMPYGVMAGIELAHAAGAFSEKEIAAIRLKLGQLGQVTTGPFGGFAGECLASEADRVQLDLNMFGRKTKTWVPIAAVAVI